MLNIPPFYHGLTRKVIVSFGSLFSNIKIQRQDNDGNISQEIVVPLTYAPKEKWLVRIEQDPALEKHTYITLPRMSFEINSYAYDSSRKLNRMQQIKTDVSNSTKPTVYTPVPYNVDISLYILTKTQEDGLQIIEQILPTFTPEYTLAVNVVPEMGITMDVPIILESVSVVDEYDGNFQDRRFVTHTLNFQMKLNLFGPVSDQGIITQVNANIGQNESTGANRAYVAEGDITTVTVTSEQWTGEGL
jgi:hypothetical protein